MCLRSEYFVKSCPHSGHLQRQNIKNCTWKNSLCMQLSEIFKSHDLISAFLNVEQYFCTSISECWTIFLYHYRQNAQFETIQMKNNKKENILHQGNSLQFLMLSFTFVSFFNNESICPWWEVRRGWESIEEQFFCRLGCV